jgi:hypothetical protein
MKQSMTREAPPQSLDRLEIYSLTARVVLALIIVATFSMLAI